MKKKFPIVLDIRGSNSNAPAIRLVSGDTNAYEFDLTLIDNNQAIDLTNHTVKLTFKKPDGTTVFQDATIVDATSGKISIQLDSQVIAAAGTVEAEANVYDASSGRITSVIFGFVVTQGLLNDSSVQSSNEYTALTTALGQVTDFTNVKTDVQNAWQGKSSLLANLQDKDSQLADKANITYVNTQIQQMNSTVQGFYSTVSALTSALPSGNNNNYVVTGNIAEVASLSVTAIPTITGYVTVTLDGVATTVAVDPATDTTTTLVATKIRNAIYAGWITGGTGTTVTFTASSVGVKTDATYSAGTTGATGTMSTTTQGVDADNYIYRWNGTIWASTNYLFNNAALAPLSGTPDKLDANLKQYPFQADAIVPLEIAHAIKEIKLFNADPTKQYVMAVLQRNVTNIWRIRIYEWTGSDFGTKVCELDQTGYTESKLVTLTSTANGIYGYVIIDWTKLSANANYNAQPYNVTGLHLLTYLNTFDAAAYASTVKLSKYPFQQLATLKNGGTSLASVVPLQNAIKKVELYGAVDTKTYALTIVRRGWFYNSTNNWQLSIYEVNGQTFVGKVAEFLVTGTYTEPSGVDVVSLSAVSSSGITAKVWIDWSQIPSSAGYDTMAYNEAGLSRLVYLAVAPESLLGINDKILGFDSHSITPTFNESGQLITVEEKDGSTPVLTSTLSYNADGTVNTVTETANSKTVVYTLHYDGNGNFTSVTKALS